MFLKKLNKFQELIIRKSFHFSVWLIEQFNDMRPFERKLEQLRELPNGTLGKEVAKCLDNNQLKLVPGYESHDLKHSLLGFQMTPLDEIRMQAFMIGNGNISIPSILIFSYGLILLPHKFLLFVKDFCRGLNSKSIVDWSLQEYAHRDLAELRTEVLRIEQSKIHPRLITQKTAELGAICALILGAVGMLYCLPFLFSPILEDLVGAGFPFVGGSILFSAGLISLSLQRRLEA